MATDLLNDFDGTELDDFPSTQTLHDFLEGVLDGTDATDPLVALQFCADVIDSRVDWLLENSVFASPATAAAAS